MKNMIQILVAFGTFFLSSTPSPAQWISPSPQGNRLISGFAIGNRAYFLGQSSALIMTGDDGDAWEQLAPYALPIERAWYADNKSQHIAFTDSLHGFITAEDLPYETSDAGRHWVQSGTPWGYGPIFFVSPRHGWKGGYSGYFRTTDGGATWNSMPASLPTDNYVTAFTASDSSHVWLITTHYSQQNSGSIKYSSDGGISWAYQSVNWGPYWDTTRKYSFVDIKVNPSGIGLACGYAWLPYQYHADGFLARTTNFGRTWSFVQTFTSVYNTILSPSDSAWILLGNNPYSQERGSDFEPSIIRSVDYGSSWKSVFEQPELPAPQTGVWIPSRKVLLAGGYYGILYRSKDLGETWEILGRRTPRLNDVDILPGTQFGLAVGDSAFILRTTDRGTSWQAGHANALAQKRFKSTSARGNKMWIGGEGGILLRTFDHGSSWEQVRLPYDTVGYYYYNIEDVSAYDSDHLAVCLTGLEWVNDKSFIFYTSDGGNNWHVWQSPNGLQAQTIQMYTENSIVTGGLYWPPGGSSGEGFVAQTIDFGHHWDTTHFPDPVVKVTMVNDSVGFTGTYGGAYKTHNGWKTVQKILTGNDIVTEIAFDEQGAGWMFRGYDLLTSTNEGETWSVSPLNMLSEERVKAMAVDSIGKMFIVTEDGSFLSTLPSIITDVRFNGSKGKPQEFTLSQNYPNPFNPRTTIEFSLPIRSSVRLDLFNILGQLVATLVDETRPAGHYLESLDASGLPSGAYFYRLRAGTFLETRKLILLK